MGCGSRFSSASRWPRCWRAAWRCGSVAAGRVGRRGYRGCAIPELGGKKHKLSDRRYFFAHSCWPSHVSNEVMKG